MFKKQFAMGLLGATILATGAFAQATGTGSSTGASSSSPAMTSSSSSSSGAAANTTSASVGYQGQWRTSKLIGVNVYNDSNESLGSINELLVDQSGSIKAVVIGVGGFLGMGERNVAVNWDKLKWMNEPVRTSSNTATRPAGGSAMAPAGGTTTGSASTSSGAMTGANSPGVQTAQSDRPNQWYPDHAVYSATKDELKNMPEFKY